MSRAPPWLANMSTGLTVAAGVLVVVAARLGGMSQLARSIGAVQPAASQPIGQKVHRRGVGRLTSRSCAIPEGQRERRQSPLRGSAAATPPALCAISVQTTVFASSKAIACPGFCLRLALFTHQCTHDDLGRHLPGAFRANTPVPAAVIKRVVGWSSATSPRHAQLQQVWMQPVGQPANQALCSFSIALFWRARAQQVKRLVLRRS
jgi:hypothetical protein